jgi:hypothetical protein
MPAPFSSLIDSSVLNLESEKKARRLIARRPVTALRADRVVLNLVNSRAGLHVVERLAVGEPGASLRLRIETSEQVVERFGKRGVGKDSITQNGVAQFAHHC